ncbi:C-type lectin domain family 4 member F-like [Myiozetetes cayanensis]|uniref:C-type lectin domain family 4 member F-like n=1 Tax=Myiozetetes cayanensis TaxID=478635 RepID=UPI00215F782F|nr:C-type lectin domain family 4 member F-like [Myiozetetes cayanensis]
MATGTDLYETLELSYGPPRARGETPAPRGCPLCPWALGTAVLLVLGAALAALGTLYVQGRAELRAVRAELAATADLLMPDPDGPRSPGETPAAARRRQDQLGRWLQGLALGWHYHAGKIYLFSAEGRPWAAAEASCVATHAHLASVTNPEEQAYLARQSRGGTYWIGLSATGPGAPGAGWTGPPTRPPTVSGPWGSRTTPTTGTGGPRAVPRSTRWATGSGTTTTATSASPGSARGSCGRPEPVGLGGQGWDTNPVSELRE